MNKEESRVVYCRSAKVLPLAVRCKARFESIRCGVTTAGDGARSFSRVRAALAAALVLTLAGVGCSRAPEYYVKRGNTFFTSAKYEDAEIQYKKALQNDPNYGEALYRLGLVSLEQNKFAEAYPVLTRAVQVMPQHNEAKVKLADTCLALYVSEPTHSRSMYDQVAKLSGQLLAENPNSFDGLRLAGTLRVFDQRPRQAIEYFEKANRIQPMQHDLVVGWSQALFQDNRFDEGQRLALALIKKEPAFAPIYDVLYRQYLTAKRLGDAENILKAKVSNNPTKADYLVELAEHYGRNQRPTDMAEIIQRLADVKGFPDGLLKAGDFYVKAGNGPEAIFRFEDGARRYPKEKLVYQKRIVDVLLLQNKRDEAATLVEAMLKDNPKDLDARRVRATLRLEGGKPGDLDAAITEFTGLAKDAPNDAVLHFNFGRAWLAKKDQGRAQKEFQEALRDRQDYVPAMNALAVLSLQQQKPDDALRYVQELLAYQPNNTGAKLLGITALAAQGRNADAQTELGYLQREFPDSVDVKLQAAFLAIGERKYQDAEKIFRSVKSGINDTRLTAGLAELYSSQQQFDKAIQVLSDDLRRSPDSSSLLALLAFTANRAGNYDQAIGAYQNLVAQEPGSAELYTRLGMAYESKGDDDSALKSLQKAKELAPYDAAATLLLGVALDKVHRTEEARANYERALQLQPDNPAAANNLAYLLAANGGDLDEALRLANRALQKSPGQPNYTDTLGYIYMKKKQNESAVRTFNSLVRQFPKSPVYHYHLGTALLETGDKAKAKTEFETALRNQPSPTDAAKLKELLSKLEG